MPLCPDRDFLGYGANPPVVRWPGHKPVAVSLQVVAASSANRKPATPAGVTTLDVPRSVMPINPTLMR